MLQATAGACPLNTVGAMSPEGPPNCAQVLLGEMQPHSEQEMESPQN